DDDLIVACLLTELTEAEVTAGVKNRLPKYMMPNVWRMYKRFPATANGKIDRPGLKEEYFREKN
ncbi:MAG: D-alanine--poly(phosphoribitol) ligase, partial [Clostridia bacterium]|nr:D-alanine--poly(phosphoribitol) ligase [Clostridia bacterium]